MFAGGDLALVAGAGTGKTATLVLMAATTRRRGMYLAHIPAAQADSARSSVAVATRLGPAVAAQAHSAFADGMHVALYIAAGTVLTAAIAVGTLLRGRGRARRSAATAG